MRLPRPILTCLLLLPVLSGCSSSPSPAAPEYRIQTGNDLKIIATTDTHYLSKKLNDEGPAFQKFIAGGDGKQLVYSDEMMSAFTYDVGLQRPDITIISGDLTNNGEKQSHLDMAKHLAAMEKSTGTRVYVIPGNHDLLNPWARKFKGERQYITDSVSPRDFSKIYADFGFEEALSRDGQSLSYLAAPSEELWLLMLDTTQSGNNQELGHPQLDGQLSSATLRWIDQCGRLAAQSGARLVAVMHHNLVDHSKLIQKGFTVNNNVEVIKALLRNGISTVFSGHIHIQDIAAARQDPKVVYDIASSALSVYPHQFGILTYSSAKPSFDYSTSLLNVELWAAATGSKDPNLLHFNAYSEESFGKISFDRSYTRLSEDSLYADYSEQQLLEMSDTVKKLNENYFAGTESTGNPAILSSEGYRLWMDSPASGLKSYVQRMTERGGKDNHHLHVELP